MKKTEIILVNGPAGSGKDESAKVLTNSGYTPLVEKFAKPLDTIVAGILGIPVNSDEFMSLREDRKEMLLGEYGLPDMTMRQLLISVSEDYIKPNFGEGYFGICAANRVIRVIDDYRRLDTQRGSLIMVTDCGFQTEFYAFTDKVLKAFPDDVSITLVNLSRDDCTFEGDSREKVVPLGSIIPRYFVTNNGTKDDLMMSMMQLLGRLGVKS